MGKAREFLTIDPPELVVPTYYVASAFDHPPWPILIGGRAVSLAVGIWGLIPDWAKSTEQATKIRNQTFNARAETIASKPAFEQASRTGRCIILLDGFFEYHKRGGKSYPFYMSLEQGGVFLVAGLCSPWTDSEAHNVVNTFSLITTEANRMLAAIHNEKKRMPAVLTDDEARLWLDPSRSLAELRPLLRPHDVPELVAHPVSRMVGSHLHERNVPSIQDIVVYPELGDLGFVKDRSQS